jgi:hypothetical protein
MKPHIHQKEIIAWANGAQIEMQREDGSWVYIYSPAWCAQYKYRITPNVRDELTDLFRVTEWGGRLSATDIVETILKKYNITPKEENEN